MSETKGAYGQVYRTTCPDFYHGSEDFPYGKAWLGVLMNDTHKEVWRGMRTGSPDAAFKAMKKAAKDHKITDLREWSGEVGEKLHG